MILSNHVVCERSNLRFDGGPLLTHMTHKMENDRNLCYSCLAIRNFENLRVEKFCIDDFG